MSIFSRLSDAFGRNNVSSRRSTVAHQEVSNRIFVNPLCSSYENLFAQVRPLINDMKMVFPYGVGRNGAPKDLRETPELSILQDPNDEMGWAEFADLAFATYLTERELNIHVWKNTRNRVFGYSILPVGCRKVIAGEEKFVFTTAGNRQCTLYRDEVMTLRYSRSPLDPDQGVSPATAVFAYTQLDDLIAQYQRAFFENGAVPASITFIKASTREKYEEKRKDLEKGLHGANNKNKTLYVWRAFNNDTGDEKDEIEVKTIQSNNSTLALKEIMEIVSDKLNKAVGVSNFIMGDDSSAKYNNAELSDYQFIKRRVYPTLMSFWSQFQHELDRITGGLGYAIKFDIELPELTDRLKTKAETAKINTESLKMMIEAGATPSNATAALGLGDNWKYVADGIYKRVLSASSIINSTSAPSLADGADQNKKLTDTHKHLAKTPKAGSTTKDAEQIYTPVFQENEKDEKFIYDELMRIAQAIADDTGLPIEEVKDALMEILTRQANDGAVAGAEYVEGLLAGNDVSSEIKKTLENDGFYVSEEFKKTLADRVDTLVDKFTADTREIVSGVLQGSEALSANEIADKLSEALPRWRAECIARNETVHAFRAGRLATDDEISNRFGLKIRKVWRCTDDSKTCPICRAMNGQTVGLRDAFPDEVETEDGVFGWEHTHWNNDGELPNAHVNCRCYFDEEVVN